MLLVLAMGLAVTPSVQAQTPREIAKAVFPSVVSIVAVDETRAIQFGRSLFVQPRGRQGSGFFVREDVVATNAHVVQGALRGLAKVIGQETMHEVLGAIAFDVQNDLALLRLSGIRGRPLPLGDPAAVGVGDQVYAVGSPQGLEGTFSPGLLSAIRKGETGMLYQITAPISQGSSGGPILNDKGQVIGVAVGIMREGQNLNFAVPVAYLQALLARPPKLTALIKIPEPGALPLPESEGPAPPELAPGRPAPDTGFTGRDRAAEARAGFEQQFQAILEQVRALGRLLGPGTTREDWSRAFQDFERRYRDFTARYQIHLASTPRERDILTKLVKAADLLLGVEESWAREVAASAEVENSRRARAAAQAQHARRQSAVSQMELEIAEENLSRATRTRETLAGVRHKQHAAAAPAVGAVEPLTPPK